MPDRLTPPFSMRSNADAIWLEDASGYRFAYTYASDVVGTGNRPPRAAAERFAAWLARSPETVARFTPDEREALGRFIASQPAGMTEAEAVRILVRDALIGMGDLELGGENRIRGARKAPP